MPIEHVSVKEYASRNGLSERTVRNYCAVGRIEGAVLVGKTWSIPADAVVAAKSIIALKLFTHSRMVTDEWADLSYSRNVSEATLYHSS